MRSLGLVRTLPSGGWINPAVIDKPLFDMIMGAFASGENRINTEENVRVLLLELDYLKQENTNLKNGLSRALRDKVAGSFIEKAEEFQQMFINKDQVIDLFRHEVSALMIAAPLTTLNGAHTEKVVEMQREMEVLITCFFEMKTTFEKYLAEI